MLILSWNVAGWAQTVRRIDADYPPDSGSGSGSGSRSQSVASYLRRHGATILCVQEAKIPAAQLRSRSEPLGCAEVPGLESYWSCNAASDPRRRGFNGVATYAPKGTVVGADPAPLGVPSLDGQGRCLATDHGAFVLFNVYAPSGGNALPGRMRFLRALGEAMRRWREERGRPVVLVGDLNIAHRPIDVHWRYRRVDVDGVLREVLRHGAGGEREDEGAGTAAAASPPLPRWKEELAASWGRIEAALRTREAVPVTTRNASTGATFAKFRVRVTDLGGGGQRRVMLGGPEPTEVEALAPYELGQVTYVDLDADGEGEGDGACLVARGANAVCVGTLLELLSKICGVEWNDRVVRDEVAEAGASHLSHSSPPREWLDGLLRGGGMVDTFRHLHPTAEGRYTCWNQHTNRRYENEGSRIDYMLVDRELLPLVRGQADAGADQDGGGLRCCGFGGDAAGEEAALHASTAGGRFRASAYEGGGIAAAPQAALDTQFAGPAHTGIVYTPPSYSDHVATSLLLEGLLMQGPLPGPAPSLGGTDAATRRAQPHKAQKSILSMFGRKAAGAGAGAQAKSGPSNPQGRKGRDDEGGAAATGKKRKGQQQIAFASKKETGGANSGNPTSQDRLRCKNPNSILSHFSAKGSG
jgi:exonuclease III